MKPPGVGAIVIDTSRPDLGAGTLRNWYVMSNRVYADVKFSSGIKRVRRDNCVCAVGRKTRPPDQPFTAEEKAMAKRYGLTPRQYRSAMT